MEKNIENTIKDFQFQIKTEETLFSSSLSEQDLKRHVDKIINELKNRKEE